jgi:hypothetical protein
LASPAYFAVNVTEPAEAPVKDTTQVLIVVDVPFGARGQLAAAEIEPDPPVAETVTIPDGMNPVTVAVQDAAEPDATLEGLHNSVVLDVACVTVRVVVATEGALLRSPAYRAVMVSLAEAAPVLNVDGTLPLFGTEYVFLLKVPAALLLIRTLPVRSLPLTAAVHETDPFPTTTEDCLQLTVVDVEDRKLCPP